MGSDTGADDFDFLIGDWSVLHRRLKQRLVGDTDWIEFSGPATARKILGGLGNVDEYRINLPTGAYNRCIASPLQSSISVDGGSSWETNWVMTFTRVRGG